jgi:short-subunit dehydrogenase
VVSLSENLYVELVRGGFKPRISVVCPGLVDTNIMESYRRRPAEFGNPSPVPAEPAAAALRERAKEALKKGLSPRAVGEQVLAAIREEQLYVLNSPELNPFIEQRMKNILNGVNPVVPRMPG